MNDPSSRVRNTIIVLGLIQGILLLLAHVLIDLKELNAPQDMLWLLPWYAVAVGMPTALQLMVTDVREPRLWWFGLGLMLALILTGAYTGYMVEPTPSISSLPIVMPYVYTTFIGWYVLLPFVQAWLGTGQLHPAYTDLFEFAWNNIITLIIAIIFTGIFWGLLALWAGLFNIIGIKFFVLLFYNKYFVYPVTTAVFAIALHIGRRHVNAVVTVRRIILAIFKGLLPLLAIIAVLFLATLPFVGLELLWDTGKATALMLILQIFTVIFLNAVFQNGQGETPYPRWLRAMVKMAVLLLPIYTALCFYALYLRIDQHGWSVGRFWALLLTMVVGLHVLGYAATALRRSNIWMGGMARVNIAIAAVVVLLSVAVNSPLLDARRISVASQVARLLEEKTSIAKFDYNYMRFTLGRHGNAALAQLEKIGGHPHAAAIRGAARQALQRANPWDPQGIKIETAAQVAKNFSVFPRGKQIDASFLQYITSADLDWQTKRCLNVGERCAVLIIDLNRDNREEYIVFQVKAAWDRNTAVFEKTDAGWKSAGHLVAESSEGLDLKQIEAFLDQGDYAVVDSPWRNLRINRHLQRFR